MTIQQQIKSKLELIGLPYKQIDCFGSQIIVTAWSESAAKKWASILAKFATVKRVAVPCLDDAKVNKGTNLCPSVVKVWRTNATI